MMKRFLSAALTCLALGLATNSQAQITSYVPRWVFDPLKFSNAAPVNTTISGYLQPDSMTATGNAARLDTTSAYPLMQMVSWPAGIINPSTATIDSLFYGILYISPVGSDLSVSADSIYLQTQVSIDGTNWNLCTPRTAFQVANTVNPYATGAWVIEQNSTNNFMVPFKQVSALTGVSVSVGATAPTELQLYGWPWIRWIIGSKNTGRYEAKFGHLAVSP